MRQFEDLKITVRAYSFRGANQNNCTRPRKQAKQGVDLLSDGMDRH